MYMYIYTYICIYIHMYIYIYMRRHPRERRKERSPAQLIPEGEGGEAPLIIRVGEPLPLGLVLNPGILEGRVD